MGCGNSRMFTVDDGVQGQDRFAMEVFMHLGLNDQDLDMVKIFA